MEPEPLIKPRFLLPVLKEEYLESQYDGRLLAYAQQRRETEPDFLKWVFGYADNVGDYGQGMTPEQEKALADFWDLVTGHEFKPLAEIPSFYLKATLGQLEEWSANLSAFMDEGEPQEGWDSESRASVDYNATTRELTGYWVANGRRGAAIFRPLVFSPDKLQVESLEFLNELYEARLGSPNPRW